MRRPPIACYRAVPSLESTALEHVWIPEDLLSAAVSRFFRTTCSHQRRHGSNVPGPLEARRRAAKRRMTLQANGDISNGMPPPLFNFAAMFGSRQTGEPRWRYEPPSLKKEEPLVSLFDIPSPIPLVNSFPAPLEPISYHFDTTYSRPLEDNSKGVESGSTATLNIDNNFFTRKEDMTCSTELGASSSTKQGHSDQSDDSLRKDKSQASATNDQVFDFVAKNFAATKDGTAKVRNAYLNMQGIGGAASMVHHRSDRADNNLDDNDVDGNSLEEWARDTVAGHAKLFEFLLAEDVALETTEATETLPVDVNACFDKFRGLIHGTSPDMFAQRAPTATEVELTATEVEVDDTDMSRPGTFLSGSYLSCCPPGSDAGRFCFLVFQYLLDSPWRGIYTVGLLGQPAVRLPDIFGPDGLKFLQIMEKEYLAPSRPQSAGVHLIYKQLAEQIQNQPSLSPSTPKAHRRLLMQGALDRDASLRMFIRGLWDSTHWETKGSQKSVYWQTKRLQYDIHETLKSVSYALSDQRLASHLRQIWEALNMDYLQAPLRFSNLVDACVEDNSIVPTGVDLLETVPQYLLRTWITSMSAEGLYDVPQLGQKSLPFIEMWFKLLYRLDIRRNVAVDDDALMCQFAFSSFVSAHFKHRYPPFILVTALLYALLQHGSLAGELSFDLYDWIESYALFLTQQDQKGAALNAMLARLVSDLAKKSLPNHGVLELMIPHINVHKSFHSVSNLLERISKSGTKLSSTTFLDGYTDQILEEISKDIDSTRLGYNFNAFRRLLNVQSNLGVTTIEPKARLEKLNSRRFFWHILVRANDAHVVPPAYRNLTPDIPKEIQTDLIHQFAFQYALDRTRSCQQNWRSIRYLYLYLKIHELPIQPMFTQTLVSACITRPLAENRFVAQKKAVWVCRLVAKVEGVEAARQVEHHFWAWRGDLILGARRELLSLGMYDPARVSMMERLKLLPRNSTSVV